MKKKSSSNLAFFSLRVLPCLIAAAFIAYALALSRAVGGTSSCGLCSTAYLPGAPTATPACSPYSTAYWPGAATPSPSPAPQLLTEFYFEVPVTAKPVFVIRGCYATSQNLCSAWQPDAYHMVVQDIRGSPGCHDPSTPFGGDLLYKFDQDDGHALLGIIDGVWWSQGPGGHIAMYGWSNGGITSYLAAVGAGASLRGIQAHYATGDLLNYGLFNGGVQHKEVPYPVDLQWRLWKVADFDHDGTSDYVLYNPGTSATAVWYLNNNNPITVRTTAYGPTITGWQLQEVDDFDGDNTPDYVLYNPGTGATAVWYLNTNLTVRTVAAGPTITSGWLLVTVGDFDGDNTPDYVLYNPTSRQTAVWYLTNSNPITVRENRSAPTITANWYLVGVGDFDGDNTPDYVLFAPTTRQTAVWYLTNSNPIGFRDGRYGPTIGAGWLPDAVDDFDHDGTPDYVLYAPTGQATAVWYLINSSPTITLREGRFGPNSSANQVSWKDYVGLGIWNKYLITDADAGSAKVAGLHVGGWFDVFGQGILDTFSRMKTAVGNGMYTKQKIVVGPWEHDDGFVVGQIPCPSPLPSPSLSDYDAKWKKGVFQNDWAEWNSLDTVKVYLMNAPAGSEWMTYNTWPPPAEEKTFYFTSTHQLSTTPQGTPGQLTFTSVPSSPCPTYGGINNLSSCGYPSPVPSPLPSPIPCGPWDQRPIEGRSDVVVFTSGLDPLGTNGGTIVGRLSADVWIQTGLPDVDVVVRMTDVYPAAEGGKSMLMAEGIQRARYRNGVCPQFLLNVPTKVHVDLGSTAFVLKRNHKLRVIVSAAAGPNVAGVPAFPAAGGYSVNPQNRDEYIGENPNNAPVSGPINVLAGPGQASTLVVPQPTGGIAPPDRRPPKPTPCPQ